MELGELLEQVNATLPAEAWVVGGAVRDLLLGKAPRDLDLALGRETPLLGLDYWHLRGAKAFWLDKSRQMVRVVLANAVTVDLAPLLAEDLSADLARRDFTVNAMALPLDCWLRQDQTGLVDPWQGQQDLLARRLRVVHEQALQADPVRILRAARLWVELSLQPDAETQVALMSASPALASAPGERIWQELSTLLCHPNAPQVMAELSHWGAVSALFPEATAMLGVEQNQHHQFTVDVHSDKAFAAFVDIIHQGSYLTASSRSLVHDYWAKLPSAEQAVIMLGAWLHDIGKPPTRAVLEAKVTFYNHEQVGATMILSVTERLKLGREQAQLAATFITYHMYPMQLWRTGHLDDRLIHRLFRRTGELGVAIVLFTLADHLAKGEGLAESPEFAKHQQVVQRLLQAYFCQHEQVISPKPWLDGEAIVRAGGQPAGPWVGRAKEALLEAQAGGQVQNQQQALAFVRQFVARDKPRKL